MFETSIPGAQCIRFTHNNLIPSGKATSLRSLHRNKSYQIFLRIQLFVILKKDPSRLIIHQFCVIAGSCTCWLSHSILEPYKAWSYRDNSTLISKMEDYWKRTLANINWWENGAVRKGWISLDFVNSIVPAHSFYPLIDQKTEHIDTVLSITSNGDRMRAEDHEVGLQAVTFNPISLGEIGEDLTTDQKHYILKRYAFDAIENFDDLPVAASFLREGQSHQCWWVHGDSQRLLGGT